jgi:hypothetical protein
VDCINIRCRPIFSRFLKFLQKSEFFLEIPNYLVGVSAQQKLEYPVWQTGLSSFGHQTCPTFLTGFSDLSGYLSRLVQSPIKSISSLQDLLLWFKFLIHHWSLWSWEGSWCTCFSPWIFVDQSRKFEFWQSKLSMKGLVQDQIKERLLVLLKDLNPLKVKPLETFKILVISWSFLWHIFLFGCSCINR